MLLTLVCVVNHQQTRSSFTFFVDLQPQAANCHLTTANRRGGGDGPAAPSRVSTGEQPPDCAAPCPCLQSSICVSHECRMVWLYDDLPVSPCQRMRHAPHLPMIHTLPLHYQATLLSSQHMHLS